MLLTASQVSTLLSVAIVLFFTSALFLAGFSIQRRTLRDLRAAIKPKPHPHPSPKIVLPDRFRAQTTELEDGTILVLESEADREARDIELLLQEKYGGNGQEGRRHPGERPVLVEVKPSVPDAKELRAEAPVETMGGSVARDQTNPDPGADDQHLVSRAERRRLIKQEIQRLTQDEVKVYYQRRLW